MQESAGILLTPENNTLRGGYRWDAENAIKTSLSLQVAEIWAFTNDDERILHSERAIFAKDFDELFKELENRNPPPGAEFANVMAGRNQNVVVVLKHPLLVMNNNDPMGEHDQSVKRMEAMGAARAHGCICVSRHLHWGDEVNSVNRSKATDPWQNTEFSNNYLLNEGFVLDAHEEHFSGTKRLWCDSDKYNRILTARRTALKRRLAKEKRKAKGVVNQRKYLSVGLTKERVFDFKDKLQRMWGKKCGLYSSGYTYLWSWDGTSYGRSTKIGHIQEIGIILEQTKGILSRGVVRRMAGFRGFILDFHHGLDQINCDGRQYIKFFCKYVKDEYKRIPAKYKKTAKKKTKKRAKKSA